MKIAVIGSTMMDIVSYTERRFFIVSAVSSARWKSSLPHTSQMPSFFGGLNFV